jgi:hypothetical protein
VFPLGTQVLDLWLSVLCMRSKAWLAARVSLRLPRTASSAQRSRRFAPRAWLHQAFLRTLLSQKHIFSMGPKLRYPAGYDSRAALSKALSTSGFNLAIHETVLALSLRLYWAKIAA